SRPFLVLVVLLAAAGCESHPRPSYTYKAAPDSAYINSSFDEKQGVFGKVPEAYVYPLTVDGDVIEDHQGVMAAGRLTPTPLMPGQHNVGAVFGSSGGSALFNFNINAQPGEHYTIKRKVVWRDGIILSSADLVTVWVEDSHGNK